MKAKKRKAKKTYCPAHIDRLYKAVQAYVKASGGSLTVIGGIQIIQWPFDLQHNFTVGIRCTGTRPTLNVK